MRTRKEIEDSQIYHDEIFKEKVLEILLDIRGGICGNPSAETIRKFSLKREEVLK